MKESKFTDWVWHLLGNLPQLAPVVLAVFGSGVTLSLLTFGLNPAIVWPLGILLSVFPVWLVWNQSIMKLPAKELKHRRLIDLLVIIGVIIWAIFNFLFVAHDVFITRDPGIYTVTGQWLVSHEKTNIHTPPIIEGKHGLTNYSGGIWLTYDQDKTILQPQGMHLFPALLGLAGRIFGTSGVFKANIILGSIALLSIYGFAKKIMKPDWAGLATLVVAISMPFIYFSRHTYTEILAMALSFGALSVLWLAQTSAAKKDSKFWLWILAGFMFGAGTMARPDAYLSVVALAIYLIVMTLLAGKNERALWIKRSLASLLAACIPIVLAILDLQRLTESYYLNTGRQIKLQLALLAVVLISGLIAIVLAWRTKLLDKLHKHTKDWRVLVVGILIMMGFLGLMLRPILLYPIHHVANNSGDLKGYVVANQTTQNTSPKLVIDHTMDWNAYYLGFPLIFASFIGIAIAAGKIMKDKQAKMLPFTMVVGLTVLMYGILPQITLDQIWAIRRFLPVILPGLTVFAIYAVAHILEIVKVEPKLKKAVTTLTVLFVLIIPLTVSWPFLFVAEGKNNYKVLTDLCAMFPKNSQVIWLGSALELDAVHTTRTYCGNYSLGYNFAGSQTFKDTGQLDQKELQKIAAENKAAGMQTILIIRKNRAVKLSPDDRKLFNEVLNYQTQQPEIVYTNAPQQVIDAYDAFGVATFDANGNLVPLTANNQQK